jgi:hypothetical protein
MVFRSTRLYRNAYMAFRLIRREDLLNCVLEKYYATSSAVRCYSNRIDGFIIASMR